MLISSCSADTWSKSFDTNNMSIYSLGVHDGKLYAGEGGTTDWSEGQGHLYSFDGSNWSLAYRIIGGYFITSIAEYQNQLYISEVNGYPYGGVELLNGSNWTIVYSQARLGVSETALVASLAEYNGKMFAGKFTALDSFLDFPAIIVYNGTDWGDGISATWKETYAKDGSVHAMKVFGGKLYAGISHKRPWADGYVDVISFNGSSWSASHNGTAFVESMEEYDGKLYVGTDEGILVYDGANWYNAYPSSHTVYALKSFGGKLYAGLESGGIIAYNGVGWQASYNSDKSIYALESYDGRLYAGQATNTTLNDGGVLLLEGVYSTTTTTTTSSTTSTTSTTAPACVMSGNGLPCDAITLSEVVSAINEWAEGSMTLAQVIDLINSWADPSGHAPN